MRPRGPQSHLERPPGRQNSLWSTLGEVLDVFRGAPGPLLVSPGLLWVAFGGALGVSGGAFLMITESGWKPIGVAVTEP